MQEVHDAVARVIVSTLPYVVLAKFAHWSIILTSLLLLLSVFVTLPFHPLWGFMLVPIGALVAIFVGKRTRVLFHRAK